MRVYVVMTHDGDVFQTATPGVVERVFLNQKSALDVLQAHSEEFDCTIDRSLSDAEHYDPRRTPVYRCTCDENPYSVDEWEVED